MNNFRTHKIIAFFLAVLMILPLIPAVDLTVFAVGENAVTEEQLKANINKTATLRNNYFAVVSDPEKNDQTVLQEGTDYDAGVMFTITDVRVIEGTPQLIYYEVALKSGVVHSNAMSTKQWIFHRSTNSSEDTASLIIGDTEPVTPSLTLDFLPAGLIAESETVSGTATINGTSVVVYKSLDNGAAGVAIAVASGTQVTLVTKYTFTTAEGAKLVFYRYDYNGDNTDLANAAISEVSGYPFIYTGALITTPVPTEKTDSATGVKINADLPEGVALTVTPKQLAEVGLNTNIYPVGASSLFYDVTLLLNNSEYQPTNGITVTFPESAILASGITVGDSYHVYHIHEGAVEMRKAAVYNGGDLALTFTGLSAVGIAETEIKKNFVTDEGAIVSNSDYLDRVAATIKVDSAILYDYIEDGANGMTVSGILNYPIVLTQKIEYSTTGFVLYRFEYILDSTDTNYDENFYNIVNGAGAHYEYIPAEYVVLITQADAVYNKLITIQTWEEWDAYCKSLDAATIELLKSLPEEKLVELDRISAGFYREKQLDMAPPAVDYTDAAPLVGFSKVVPAVYNARSGIARMALLANDVQPQAEEPENGLILDKKVELKDGVYTITLEAYTTGSVTPGEATPSDIILVLDLSTSMNQDFASYNYTAVYDLDKSKKYYLYDGTEVEWCSDCNSWTTGCGWFFGHTKGEPKTPKKDASSDGEQFYTRTKLSNTISRIEALQEAMTSFIETVADQGTADRIALVGFHTSGVRLTGNSNATAFLDATEQEAALKSIISGLNGNLKGATEHGKGMELARQIFDAQSADTYNNRNKVVVMVTDGEPAPSGTNNWSSRTVKQAIEESYILKSPTHGATVYTISVMPGTDASNPTTSMDRYMDYMSSNYPDARFTASSFDNKNTSGDSYYDKNNVEIEEESEEIVNTIVPGTKVQTTGSYYLSAGNLEALDSIFGKIAEQTGGASIKLDATTQIKDIISPYFTLPDGASKDNIIVSTKDATYTDGTLDWTTSTIENFDPKVTIEGKNVSVNGFDFTHNFVAENGRVEGDVSQTGNFHGRKLIITFEITPDPDFLGGDDVVTNNDLSGVYDKDGNEIERFEVPTTNVALKDIRTELTPKHIYYGNTVDLTGILDLWIDLTGEDHDVRINVDGVMNAYVDLLYTIKLNDSTIATYYVPAGEVWGSKNCIWTDTTSTSATALLQNYQALEDTSFEVTCQMTSKNNLDNVKNTNPNSEWVYVYKPTLEFQDSRQKYMAPLDPATDFLPSHWYGVVWKHGEILSTDESVKELMEGDAPTLSLSYAPADENAFANGKMNSIVDVPVVVTAEFDGTWSNNVIGISGTGAPGDDDNVTFVNTGTYTKCVHPGCEGISGNQAFIVHVYDAITSLTIMKTGDYSSFSDIDPNQTFIFTVTGETDGVDLTVTIHGNGTVTIDGLMVGYEYTVTELESWSWRYNCTGISASGLTVKSSDAANGVAVVILAASGNVISFMNTRSNQYWLDGDSWCDNRFMSNVSQAIN